MKAPANLHPKSRHPDDGNAFLPDPRDGGPSRVSDDLAENLAEEFVSSATSAEESVEGVRDEIVPEEQGGPFLEVPASREFDGAPDLSNPEDAEREPFPRAVRASVR
jgi:hypothetical protein